MINLLVLIVVVLIVLALVLYAIKLLPMIEPPFKQIIMAICVLIAILVILVQSGLLAGRI